MRLLTVALAVFWAWEYIRVVLPVPVPAWLQPALVAGLAFEARHVPTAYLTAAAVAGLVAVLHRYVTSSAETAQLVTRRRPGRIPPL
jgi:hypothetical protein